MRREYHDTHSAHYEARQRQARARASAEPLKRSYERIVAGEEAFPDELVAEPVAADAAETEVVEAAPVEARKQTPEELEREVDQTLAWRTGSGETKYGSLKKPE